MGMEWNIKQKTVKNLAMYQFREGFKNNHWICDHDHTSPDPPPSFLKTVIAFGYFFAQFFVNMVIRYVLKQVLVVFETNFGYVLVKLTSFKI